MAAMHLNTKNRNSGPPRHVVEVRPLALGTEQAAQFIGRSASWLRSMRVLDARRGEQGLAPVGPTWRALDGHAVVYLTKDLERWLLSHSVERGRVPFRGATAEVEP